MTRFTVLLAAALPLAILPARAAETYETTLLGDGDRPAASVSFNASCGAECYAASLACDADGSIGFDFGDVEAKIAAAAITGKKQEFTLKAGGAAYAFFIMKLEYGGEMNGTWMVNGELRESRARDFAAALGKAKNFKATIGGESLTLPVTADVKTWAAACKK